MYNYFLYNKVMKFFGDMIFTIHMLKLRKR